MSESIWEEEAPVQPVQAEEQEFDAYEYTVMGALVIAHAVTSVFWFITAPFWMPIKLIKKIGWAGFTVPIWGPFWILGKYFSRYKWCRDLFNSETGEGELERWREIKRYCKSADYWN